MSSSNRFPGKVAFVTDSVEKLALEKCAMG